MRQANAQRRFWPADKLPTERLASEPSIPIRDIAASISLCDAPTMLAQNEMLSAMLRSAYKPLL
jgi:hypothetical protein